MNRMLSSKTMENIVAKELNHTGLKYNSKNYLKYKSKNILTRQHVGAGKPGSVCSSRELRRRAPARMPSGCTATSAAEKLKALV